MERSIGTFGEGDKPDIDYPLEWTYKVIGSDEGRVRAAIDEVVGGAEHTVRPSNQSRSGKYLSLELLVVVVDEAQRVGYGEALLAHADVRFVL